MTRTTRQLGPPGDVPPRRTFPRQVAINAYRAVAPHVPFGLTGASVLGRGYGVDAVRDDTETTSVLLQFTGATRDPLTLG